MADVASPAKWPEWNHTPEAHGTIWPGPYPQFNQVTSQCDNGTRLVQRGKAFSCQILPFFSPGFEPTTFRVSLTIDDSQFVPVGLGRVRFGRRQEGMVWNRK